VNGDRRSIIYEEYWKGDWDLWDMEMTIFSKVQKSLKDKINELVNIETVSLDYLIENTWRI
jgi:hypothetical protein